MARKDKYDGVITAVRYMRDGQVDWVRAFERRGPTFSDHVMIHRANLISQLKAGKKFVVGERQPYIASTFEVWGSVHLESQNGDEFLVSDKAKAGKTGDDLTGVPLL